MLHLLSGSKIQCPKVMKTHQDIAQKLVSKFSKSNKNSRLWFFKWSCMDVRVELWRRLNAEELMLLNCGVREDSWESLDCKELQPVHSKGNQSWVFIGRTDAEAETPILWPPDVKNWLTGKGSDAGKDWGQEGKGTIEDEMVRWHHWLNEHYSEQTLK